MAVRGRLVLMFRALLVRKLAGQVGCPGQDLLVVVPDPQYVYIGERDG